MSKIIGIDLGTTNSAVAVLEGGEPKIITNPDTIISIKSHMGEAGYKVNVDGKDYTPQEISAMILQYIKGYAEDYLGEKVEKAVITVPAYFNDAQRQATKDAGKIAGLEVERIINEPTAAALAYGLDKLDKDEKILVYDLGGGTFDVSILELGDGVFEVLSTNGDTHLGGDDFDNKIIDYLAEQFKAENGIDLKEDKLALQRLKDAAESAKKTLSSATEAQIDLPFIASGDQGPLHLQTSLTRAKFNELTADLIKKAEQPVLNALKDAGLSFSDIDEVILNGGSTRIPAVQESVKKLTGKEPNHSINPDEAVALGAAVQGGVITGDVKDVVLLDVTPLSLGIETMGGVFTKLIDRNTTIPTSKSQVFSTAADNQPAVDIHVLQGERSMAADNKTLGRFQLSDIPAAKRGVPQIEVTFDIDRNGIVSVSAKDLGTQKEQKITIQAAGGLTDEEIEQMMNDAKANEEADAKKKAAVDTRNEADQLIFSTEATLEEVGDKLEEDAKKATKDALEALKQAKEKVGDDVEADLTELKEKSEALAKAAQELAMKLYQQAAPQEGAEGEAKPKDDNTVDGDFEEVDPSKK